MKYKAIDKNKKLIHTFNKKDEIEPYIQTEIKKRGLDWRVGYLVCFRDGLIFEVFDKNNKSVKY